MSLYECNTKKKALFLFWLWALSLFDIMQCTYFYYQGFDYFYCLRPNNIFSPFIRRNEIRKKLRYFGRLYSLKSFRKDTSIILCINPLRYLIISGIFIIIENIFVSSMRIQMKNKTEKNSILLLIRIRKINFSHKI